MLVEAFIVVLVVLSVLRADDVLEKAFIVVLVVLPVLLAELVLEPDGAVKRGVALKPDIAKLESTSDILFQDYSDSLVLV